MSERWSLRSTGSRLLRLDYGPHNYGEDGWVDWRVDGWVDGGWMDGRLDGWMDGSGALKNALKYKHKI